MPYVLVGKCVHKQKEDGSAGDVVPGGCHDTEDQAKAHMRALYANVKKSDVVEMSMRITKATYNTHEKPGVSPMKWSAIDSDTEDDLYAEKMSSELFADFSHRIQNNTPVPEAFKSVICEDSWCGGMPYLSIAHYKAGADAKNVPGVVDAVYIDGNRLKSKGSLHDTALGRAVFESLRHDDFEKKSGNSEHLPVRISIGFLDLQHKHVTNGKEFIFTRSNVGQICPLCDKGIGGKIYLKGQLVHLALTRVPVNPRTEMIAEKSMGDEIKSKQDDARSIVKELADELDMKSLAEGTLVIRATEASEMTSNGSKPVDDYSKLCEECYDPNNGSFDQDCVNKVLSANSIGLRKEFETVKSMLGEVLELAKRKDVTPADKKRAEKEYGDVKYADEANKKYPIDTDEHIRAALSYWGMPKNRAKYSAEDQKKIGARIHAAAKKAGINVSEKSDVVEDSMSGENVEKMNLGGENVAEQEFEYDALGVNINGDPQKNIIPNPLPQKAATKAAMDKEEEDETPADEKREKDREGDTDEKSLTDKAYAKLKSLMAKGASVDEINGVFSELGTAVEQEYKPKSQVSGVDTNDLAAIVKSAVESAVAPLKMEIATLKAQGAVNKSANGVPASRALSRPMLKPEDFLQKSKPAQAPVNPDNQFIPKSITDLARKSVYHGIGKLTPEEEAGQ